MAILVDSSSWVQFIRPNGDAAAKARVTEILNAGNAAWCPIVRLELWNGVGSAHEKRILSDLDAELPMLPIGEGIWDESVSLAIAARSRGMSVPAADLLIFACARAHGVGIEHFDKHFELLLQLK